VFNSDKNIIVAVIYRAPNREINSFNEKLNDVLNIIKNENKICYLLGDYNINLFNSDSHAQTSDFLDICFSNNFLPLINKPTRITKYSATLIDNIFTNDVINSSISHGIFLADISDHFPIFAINKKFKQNEKTISKKRILSNNNLQRFHDALQQYDFNHILELSDVNTAMNSFHNEFCELYYKCFPLITVKRKYSNNKPWLTEGLKQSIKRKNILYKRFLKYRNSETENDYKLYRNKVQHLLRVAERKHYHDIISYNKNNLKKTWSVMKSIINKKQITKRPEFFLYNNRKITNKSDIANRFNDYFVNIGSSLARKIPDCNKSAMSFLSETYNKILFLNPVSRNELIITIKQLKVNSASGWDDIPAKVLQVNHLNLLDPLLHIVNLSLNQGIFPDLLKIAKVIPLYKGNELCHFTNYRPISILNAFSKIFERVFYNRLYDFLIKENILYDKQFGFRKQFSTEMALLLLTDKISAALELGEFVLGVFLDFSKAFDTVNHAILLDKLQHYGIRGVANNWIRSYLCERSQYVCYDGEKSSVKSISCGVPQGSILGPLLFLVYINDLSKISNNLFMLMYADDTNIFLCGKRLRDLEILMNTELSSLTEWLNVNKLSLNVSKTHYMLFTPPRLKVHYNINLYTNNTEIHSVTQTKFLGVMLDSKLSWKPHMKYISTKVSKNIGILSKAKRYLEFKSLTCLYYSFIYPYIVYCIAVWGGANVSTLEPLIKVQKWAIKTILCKPRITPSLPLFKSMKLLTIQQIYTLQVLVFVFKFKKSELPCIFNNFFIPTSNIHEYSTRQEYNFYPPMCRTNLAQSFIRYAGCYNWNCLSRNIKSFNGSISSFKKHILKSLFE
jgi:hypothetical protein